MRKIIVLTFVSLDGVMQAPGREFAAKAVTCQVTDAMAQLSVPVPPESPLISTTSAFAFDTPAATVPTPTSATSLTLIRARLFEFLRS